MANLYPSLFNAFWTASKAPVAKWRAPKASAAGHSEKTVPTRDSYQFGWRKGIARIQAGGFAYSLPDPPIALPLGPTVATNNPSPSYYAKAEGELNTQQQAYAEALQEQNRAMKKRIETLQKKTERGSNWKSTD